ncbi:hypothetical protein FSP39_020165 [Pinctada imbricata]|uniref:Rieske domain-containing protein n=1 Tax=Pinctada imbricata TaxID=66713 RepID=A0AA88XGE8_PINIB|nr:hypothetical protein FSP39_020165 [Pinctada imbricata]
MRFRFYKVQQFIKPTPIYEGVDMMKGRGRRREGRKEWEGEGWGKGRRVGRRVRGAEGKVSKRNSQIPVGEETYPASNGVKDHTGDYKHQGGDSVIIKEEKIVPPDKLDTETEHREQVNGEERSKHLPESQGKFTSENTEEDQVQDDTVLGSVLPEAEENTPYTENIDTNTSQRTESEECNFEKEDISEKGNSEDIGSESSSSVKVEEQIDLVRTEDSKEDSVGLTEDRPSEDLEKNTEDISAAEDINETLEELNLEQSTEDLSQDPTGFTSPLVEDFGGHIEDKEEEESENMADMVEAEVCGVEDMKDGDMREVDIGEGKALLVRDGQEYYAVGAKCTHYGAPLSKGVLGNGRVRCPWHGACFNVKTGDIEDFPGLDSIPKFEVSIANGKVKVKAAKSALANHKRVRQMCQGSGGDNSVLIVGGGAASMACSETLRQEGFQGKITIATMEKNKPYDRPKLSKAMDVSVDSIALRNDEFYNKYNINVLTEKEATSVNTDTKTVSFKDGTSETYNSLVVATGGRPRVLPIPGVDLKNVCQLRTPADANFIAENAKGKNVVIIGSSFIGMEVAAFLVDKACSVSVIVRGLAPFQNIFGLELGSVLKKMHEEKGIKFYFESGIKEFVGTDGSVTEAVLSTDVRLPADLCILGVGVVPATDFLKGSGINMTDRGFIPVDKEMKTDKPGVYAAGDIVEFPLFTVGDKNVNIQHWQMAHKHGHTAALSILGKPEQIKSVPFFWTVQYGKSIRYTGYGPGYDDVVVHGDLDALKFVAYYTKGEEVVAVASLNFDPIVAQAAEYMYSGKTISKKEVQESPDAWTSKL